MTPQERQLCLDLIIAPPSGRRKISKEGFASRFPSAIEHGALATRLLEEALQSKNSDDLQCALIVGHAFAFAPDQAGILSLLLDADWLLGHEDVVSALAQLRSPVAVHALLGATERIPAYLRYDDSRALATKAIWALGAVPGEEAESALQKLAASNVSLIQQAARQQLDRRKAQRSRI